MLLTDLQDFGLCQSKTKEISYISLLHLRKETIFIMVYYKHIPLYFILGVLGFVSLFILCCILNLVMPCEKIRQTCALCCGYEKHDNQLAKKQRRKLLNEEEDDEEEGSIYLKYHRTHLI